MAHHAVVRQPRYFYVESRRGKWRTYRQLRSDLVHRKKQSEMIHEKAVLEKSTAEFRSFACGEELEARPRRASGKRHLDDDSGTDSGGEAPSLCVFQSCWRLVVACEVLGYPRPPVFAALVYRGH